MDNLYRLRDMLCKELEEYGKGDLSAGSLSTIDTLAHALKNIDKIIMYKDDEYSERGYPMGGSYRYSRDGGSYRGGMRGYSRHDGMADEIRNLMDNAPDNVKRDLQRVLDKIEQG